MIKHLLLIFPFLIYSNSYSQKHDSDTTRTTYLTINSFKAQYNEVLTKVDSLNIKIINGDTLIKVDNYVRPKGVSVPYEFKDSTFLYYYKKVAFNHKSDSINKNTYMKYWKDDIRIFFSKSVSKSIKKEFMSFAKEIDKQVDSLKISMVKKVEDSNYIIYYLGDYEYESQLVNKLKSSYVYWNNNRIYKGSIKVDSKAYFNDKLKLYYLKEKFVQTLGYFKLSDEFDCSSYFSNCYSENKTFSDLDWELLDYHYSYGICKGTDLQTFEDQHKRAKNALKKQNQFIRFFHPE